MRNSKIASAAVVASLFGGVAIGSFVAPPMAAFAADNTTEDTTESTARNPGQWITDTLKGFVDKGTISQAESDELATALQDAAPRGGHGGRGGHIALYSAAGALGISETELKSELTTKSIATLAEEKNVDLQKVIDALVAEHNTRLTQAVSDGRMTQEQADDRKADVTEKVTAMVNNVRPAGGLKGGPRGGGFGPGVAPADAPAA